MVVVWEVDKSGVPTEQEAMRGERRQRFHAALEAEGLQLEFEGPTVGSTVHLINQRYHRAHTANPYLDTLTLFYRPRSMRSLCL